MKNRIERILIILLLLIIQISFINSGLLFGLYPNILLVYVIYISQKLSRNYGVFVAVITGFLYDSLLSPNFGIRALAFLLVSLLIYSVSEYIFDEDLKIATMYTFVGIVFYHVILTIIYFFLSYGLDLNTLFYNIFSLETLLSILVFIIYQKIKIDKIKILNLAKRRGANNEVKQ